MKSMSQDHQKGLSYRDAGVDIDAGNALVERIKPHAKRTARKESLGPLVGSEPYLKSPRAIRVQYSSQEQMALVPNSNWPLTTTDIHRSAKT